MQKGESVETKIVCNSSPLINLSKIDKLDLIEKLYGRIIIPKAVYEEIIVRGHDKDNIIPIKSRIDNNIINVVKVKSNELVRALEKDLDWGESEVIALAIEINAELVIIDENDAREIAEIYGFEKTGFLGILMKAHTKGLISSVKELLDQAIEKGFWINNKLYRHIVSHLDEK